jgi:hypothetical protein
MKRERPQYETSMRRTTPRKTGREIHRAVMCVAMPLASTTALTDLWHPKYPSFAASPGARSTLRV